MTPRGRSARSGRHPRGAAPWLLLAALAVVGIAAAALQAQPQSFEEALHLVLGAFGLPGAVVSALAAVWIWQQIKGARAGARPSGSSDGAVARLADAIEELTKDLGRLREDISKDTDNALTAAVGKIELAVIKTLMGRAQWPES